MVRLIPRETRLSIRELTTGERALEKPRRKGRMDHEEKTIGETGIKVRHLKPKNVRGISTVEDKGDDKGEETGSHVLNLESEN